MLMELRGQDNQSRMPTPSSLVYNNPAKRDSSASTSSAAQGRSRDQPVHADKILNHTPPQTLDHPFPYHHQPMNPQHHLRKPRVDSDPDPDLAPAITNNRSSIRQLQNQTQVQQPTAQQTVIRYKECLKNHAAAMGGHVLDGCGEFMPGGEEGTPDAFKCAACDCHRNFHRKEINGESQYSPMYHYHHNPNKENARWDITSHLPQSQPQAFRPQRFSYGMSVNPIAPMMMTCGEGNGAESSSEDLNIFGSNAAGQLIASPPSSKKRMRTKISQEQKEKMMEFAAKLGWRILKQDEEQVQQFCAQVGVERKVFKVWMHNNKQAMKKKQM